MSTVNLENKTILVTGAAGFIGSNLVKRIYEEVPSATVIGIDNMNAYYDVALKEFRLNELAKYSTFTFVKGNIADKALITDLFEKYKPAVVVNLAAQAGVRYSITNPDAYVESNLVGFFNILEACRHCESLEHLVYASSSSVYGSNKKVPYSTDDKVDNPVSLYAAKGDYICVSNVHTTVTSYEDASYCAVQNGGLMAIPDGGPLSTVGQKRGHKNMSRTTGPSLMGEVFKISAEKGYRHYFYGSKEETLELLYQKLTQNYPGIQIAGMYSPPFRPLTEEEDKAVIERINETKPDFVWIGLGAPKQEKWMAAHQGKIDGLMLGVGAGFDYYAENIKRAPMWMQKSNLEWVYRLMQDPKRLFKRYWSTNTKFIWNAMIRGK